MRRGRRNVDDETISRQPEKDGSRADATGARATEIKTGRNDRTYDMLRDRASGFN